MGPGQHLGACACTVHHCDTMTSRPQETGDELPSVVLLPSAPEVDRRGTRKGGTAIQSTGRLHQDHLTPQRTLGGLTCPAWAPSLCQTHLSPCSPWVPPGSVLPTRAQPHMVTMTLEAATGASSVPAVAMAAKVPLQNPQDGQLLLPLRVLGTFWGPWGTAAQSW